MNLHEQQKKRYTEMANEDANKALWNQKRSLEEENTLLKKQNEVLLDALNRLYNHVTIRNVDLPEKVLDEAKEAIAQCTK
jgi:hypothetical protein